MKEALGGIREVVLVRKEAKERVTEGAESTGESKAERKAKSTQERKQGGESKGEREKERARETARKGAKGRACVESAIWTGESFRAVLDVSKKNVLPIG